MPTLGLFVSGEEHSGSFLLDAARRGEQAGFSDLLVSDHYHPWNDAQGHSPFVWTVLGAIAASTGLRLTTGVTCPTVRVHPAIIAQAAATVAEMTGGRFRLGVGSGEALNEHILGDRWPGTDTRLEMLEEAVDVMRRLWGGGFVTHRGAHYTVESARVYEHPAAPIPVIVSGFGPKSTDLAARIGDGFVTVQPDAGAVRRYRDGGGRGPALGCIKVCWDADPDAAVQRAHRLWATEELPGELNQTLPMPAHFEQVTQLVTPEMVAKAVPCGPDAEPYIEGIKAYADAGFDEIFVSPIGDDVAGFLDFFAREVQPQLGL